MSRLCPSGQPYNHNDLIRRKPPIAVDERPNAHSHLMHLLQSTSETIPLSEFHLMLGTWQRVFMVELDGPRTREVMLRFHSYVPPQPLVSIEKNGNAVSRTNGHQPINPLGFGASRQKIGR